MRQISFNNRTEEGKFHDAIFFFGKNDQILCVLFLPSFLCSFLLVRICLNGGQFSTRHNKFLFICQVYWNGINVHTHTHNHINMYIYIEQQWQWQKRYVSRETFHKKRQKLETSVQILIYVLCKNTIGIRIRKMWFLASHAAAAVDFICLVFVVTAIWLYMIFINNIQLVPIRICHVET